MDNMSQKSYKQHSLDECIKNGIVCMVKNPKGVKYQELYFCKVCHSQQPKVKSHILDHVVCQKHNLTVARLKKPSPPQAQPPPPQEQPPPQNKIAMLEMENERLREENERYKKIIDKMV